ncbi:MAG: bifunctional folylpolyglutamate synthase/dihydrofolate synthase [Cytophagaceae bacterium]
MFEKVGKPALKKGLDNITALCHFLGNPQNNFKSIHIAGTNGKGSSSHMIASILQHAGYKTGLFTSPHLKSFTERVRINGVPVSEQEVVDFVEKNKAAFEEIHPSFFEMTTALAFHCFRKEKVDVAVIETGLGGRLDSTNIISPEACLITNISFDHMNILGNDLKSIAGEKAGIIKSGVPVVISERQEEVMDVFVDKAKSLNAPIVFSDERFIVKNHLLENGYLKLQVSDNKQEELFTIMTDLIGDYQLKNIPGVLALIDVLSPEYKISREDIIEGLRNVVPTTGLKGRWQKIGERPLVICDTGHNEDGIKNIVRQLRSIPFRQLHMVIGMSSDKDIKKMISLLPDEAFYYFCQPDLPRAADADMLLKVATESGKKGRVVKNVNEAVLTAKANAEAEDVIFIGGSTFVVAELEI